MTAQLFSRDSITKQSHRIL